MGKLRVPLWPGIGGRKSSSIKEPARTVLVVEFAGWVPYSWHEPAKACPRNDVPAMISFVDGHVSLTRMYWDSATTNNHIEAWQHDPPAGYAYKWSGD